MSAEACALHRGDVLPADRLMCSWWEIVMLQQRGVDSVCRFISHRATAFRRGRRLGKGDRIVERLYEVLGRKLHAS